MKNAPGILWASAALSLLAALLPAAGMAAEARSRDAAAQIRPVAVAVPIGGKFALADATGRVVTDKTYVGKWQLIFFGFTSCPDVCSTVMGQVAAALEDLGQDSAKIQPLFITMDPEHDSPQRVSEYLDTFDSRIVGLHGSQAQTEQALKAFHVYRKQRQRGDTYTLDHSALLYLMKPDGSFGKLLSGDTGGHALSAELKASLLQDHAR